MATDQHGAGGEAIFPVIGEGGWRGTAYPAPSEERDGLMIPRVLVRPDDSGPAMIVPAGMLARKEDGAHYLPLTRSMAVAYAAPEVGVAPSAVAAGTAEAAATETGPVSMATGAAVGASSGAATERVVVPIVEEQLHVSKRVVDTGRGVRVTKSVRETTEVIDEPLLRDEVSVERVPVNRVMGEAEQVRARQEGDVVIVPVVEEVLVVQKRLMVREEIRITRQARTVREPQEVTLRHEEVAVERFEGRATAASNDLGDEDDATLVMSPNAPASVPTVPR